MHSGAAGSTGAWLLVRRLREGRAAIRADVHREPGEPQVTPREGVLEHVLLAGEERARRLVLGDDDGPDPVGMHVDAHVDVTEPLRLELQADLPATAHGRK